MHQRGYEKRGEGDRQARSGGEAGDGGREQKTQSLAQTEVSLHSHQVNAGRHGPISVWYFIWSVAAWRIENWHCALRGWSVLWIACLRSGTRGLELGCMAPSDEPRLDALVTYSKVAELERLQSIGEPNGLCESLCAAARIILLRLLQLRCSSGIVKVA